MKKALLISNVATKFTNFIIPSIETLNELGYEVHSCANYSNFNDDKSKYNVHMHHIDFIRNPFNPKNIKAYRQLLKLMKEENFDLIHCNTPIGGLLGRICAKKTNVPNVIYTAHGFHFFKGAPIVNRILYKNMEKYLAHYTDILITINKEDYEAAQKFRLRNNGSIKLVHGVGIDTNVDAISEKEKEKLKEMLLIKDNEIVCISVGELNDNKNHTNIIYAIAKTNDNVKYLICGVGEKKKELESIIKKLGIEDRVFLLGYRNDILKLLQISDIFIQMSYREGLPRSIMEAMSIGIPSVVSNIRGNVDLIINEKGGFVCNPNNYKEIAEKINLLVNDEALRKQMGNNNKQMVKNYDIKVVKEELKNIYEEV